MSHPQIEIIQQGRVVQTVPMTVTRLVVGSGEAAHVRLNAASVHPEHLLFEIIDGRHVEAVNIAGDPRLQLDALPMTRARLNHGQYVTLGPLAFRVLLPAAPVAAPPPQPMQAAPPPQPPPQPQPASRTPLAQAAAARRQKAPPLRFPSVIDLPTIAPEYRAAKRRKVVLGVLTVVLLVAAAGGWYVYREIQFRKQADEFLARQAARDAASEEPAEYTWSGLVGEGVTISRDDPAPTYRTTSSRGSGSGGAGGAAGSSRSGGSGSSVDFDSSGGSVAGAGFSMSGGGSAADDGETEALGALGSEGRDDRVLDELAKMDAALWDEQYGSGSSRKAYVDMEQVEAVLQGVTGSARMCYKDAVEDQPQLSGVMKFSLTLSTAGKITNVGLDPSSTLTDPTLKSCIEKYIRAKTYPKAKNGSVTFTYPMRFQ